jgi:hypothetical protein
MPQFYLPLPKNTSFFLERRPKKSEFPGEEIRPFLSGKSPSPFFVLDLSPYLF